MPAASDQPPRFRLSTCAILLWCSLRFAVPLHAAAPAADPAAAVQPSARKASPAETRFWAAVALLKKPGNADQAKGRAELQAAADLEYPQAQSLLADCLMAGAYGFPKNQRKAANCYRLAAERGYGFAQASLGLCYATGTGVWKSEEKAVFWLTAALEPKADYTRSEPPPPGPGEAGPGPTDSGVAGALNRDPVAETKAGAHFLLAQILSRRDKLAEAQPHYVAAANAGEDGRSGLYPAALMAALNYALGQGVPRDSVKADAMLTHSRQLVARASVSMIHNYVDLKIVDDFAAADLEDEFADKADTIERTLQSGIGDILANKKSKDYNPQEAAKWYKLAAENGQVWAMLDLAALYAGSELGAPDMAQAFHWFEQAGGGDKPKHDLGVANLAICLQNGLGTPKDPARAAALFKKYRDRIMVCYLGTIGQCPDKILNYDEAARLTETWAKRKKDPQAQYLYALFLLGKKDSDGAVRWLERAAKSNHVGALYRLGKLQEPSPADFLGYDAVYAEGHLKKAVGYYQRAVEAGNVDAMVAYAGLLTDGRGSLKADYDQAERMYRKALALEPRHGVAHCNLGLLYLKRNKLARKAKAADEAAKWSALAIKELEAAAQNDNALGALTLGWTFHDGEITQQDLRRAYGLFEQAAELNLPLAHYALGMMLEQGEGVPVSGAEAAYHYRLAALEGHIESLRRLINLYLGGRTGSVDLDRAMFWLDLYVRNGEVGAIPTMCDILIKQGAYESVRIILEYFEKSTDVSIAGYANDRLSHLYAGGLGVKRNPATAETYTIEAIRLGNADALTQLGNRQLANNLDAAAISSFRKAAAGSGQACFILGKLLYFGTHVAQNQEEGVKFLRQGAGLNNSEAMIFLAAMTYNKVRVPGAPTPAEALAYAQQAETLGHPKGAKLRELLEKQLATENAAPEESGRARSS